MTKLFAAVLFTLLLAISLIYGSPSFSQTNLEDYSATKLSTDQINDHMVINSYSTTAGTYLVCNKLDASDEDFKKKYNLFFDRLTDSSKATADKLLSDTLSFYGAVLTQDPNPAILNCDETNAFFNKMFQ
jgi:hypothetical protein